MGYFRAQVQEFLGHFKYRLARNFLPDLIHNAKIDLVFDVGANEGQFSLSLKKFGYRGRIVSFEPLEIARRKLEKRAALDSSWFVEPFALGKVDETRLIYRTKNLQSSSLLKILPAHLEAAPESREISSETIRVKRLDDLFGKYDRPESKILLKIDTQGFEKQVLAGATNSLPRVNAVHLEISLVPLYKNQSLIEDLFLEMRQQGFTPVDIQPMFRNRTTFQLLQCDVLFLRESTSVPQSLVETASL